MRRYLLPIGIAALFAAGCDDSKPAGPTLGYKQAERNQDQAQAGVGRDGFAAEGAPAMPAGFAIDQKPAGGGMGPGDKAPAAAASVARKIIYTGNIDLIVKDFDEAGRQIHTLVAAFNGYIAKSDVGILTGERRRASWTLRIPVAKFQNAMDAIAELGYASSTKHDSQDITDEFYDLEARLSNKQVEEKRLLDHLQKSTGKLEDILAVEKELTRVRGEIEFIQGRLQKLSKLSELTTIIVTMQERKGYDPPTAPSYTSALGRTLGDSWGALTGLFRGLTIALVALIPWLPFIALGVGVPWWLLRRSRRTRRTHLVVTAIEPVPPAAGSAPLA